MNQLSLYCSNCKQEIEFVSQIESGYTCCWDMFETLVDKTKNSSNLACPHCGDFLWHPLLQVVRDKGKSLGKKEVAEQFSKLILKD